MSEVITFIIPTIGRNTLERTINSLILQTNPNWRAIVIFDGVKSKSFNDNRIICISIEKKGIIGRHNGESGFVRNVGLKMVDTEWIGFVDDDDTLNSKYVATLFDKYSNKDVVLWRMITPDGLVIPRYDNNNLVFGNVGISFCYRNKYNDLYFETQRSGEDLDLFIKLIKKTNNYVISDEVYYNVRQ